MARQPPSQCLTNQHHSPQSPTNVLYTTINRGCTHPLNQRLVNHGSQPPNHNILSCQLCKLWPSMVKITPRKLLPSTANLMSCKQTFPLRYNCQGTQSSAVVSCTLGRERIDSESGKTVISFILHLPWLKPQ
jgi:hypothetical protein